MIVLQIALGVAGGVLLLMAIAWLVSVIGNAVRADREARYWDEQFRRLDEQKKRDATR